MFIFLSLFQIMSSVWAQGTSPLVDPDKFTICAITINSDDEKKLFAKEAAKNPSKFNPVVELTTMGDNDWFSKACASGIRCDQLVISGHFGGTFFGESGKTLSLTELEKAGCSKTCENILSKPYEVFLFGCNTLASKEADHRTPAQYLQVLLQDGFSPQEAEQVVESRYGAVGESNRASMQRAFHGENKQLYGFDSVGPSGKNVKGYLENYFKKQPNLEHMEKLQAKRMLDKVDLANDVLAQSLKNTAFAQCTTGNMEDPTSKKICNLVDSKKSVDEKIDLVLELLSQENYLAFLPAINNFLQTNPPENFNSKQKKNFELISQNETIKNQILGLIEKTKTLGLKIEWNQFAKNLGFISDEERHKRLKDDILKLVNKPMSTPEKDTLCSLDTRPLFEISDIKKREWNDNDVMALACLGFSSPDITASVEKKLLKAKGRQSLIAPLHYLISIKYYSSPEIAKIDLSDAAMKKIKTLAVNKDDDVRRASLMIWARTKPNDPEIHKKLQAYFNGKSKDERLAAIQIYCWELDNGDEKIFSNILNQYTNEGSVETRTEILSYLTATKNLPESVIEKIGSLKKDPKITDQEVHILDEIIKNNNGNEIDD